MYYNIREIDRTTHRIDSYAEPGSLVYFWSGLNGVDG